MKNPMIKRNTTSSSFNRLNWLRIGAMLPFVGISLLTLGACWSETVGTCLAVLTIFSGPIWLLASFVSLLVLGMGVSVYHFYAKKGKPVSTIWKWFIFGWLTFLATMVLIPLSVIPFLDEESVSFAVLISILLGLGGVGISSDEKRLNQGGWFALSQVVLYFLWIKHEIWLFNLAVLFPLMIYFVVLGWLNAKKKSNLSE